MSYSFLDARRSPRNCQRHRDEEVLVPTLDSADHCFWIAPQNHQPQPVDI